MSNTNLRQAKLHKLVMEPEATLGTAETLDASSLVIPATDVSMSPDRGSRVIDRTSLMDGFAGDVEGAIGTWAWSLSFTSEVHDCGNTVNTLSGYWPRLLGSCGWRIEDDGSNLTCYPTTVELGDFSAGATTDPFGATFGYIQNNNGTSDTSMRSRGSTGTVDIDMSVGQPMTLSCNYKGLIVADKLLDTATADLSAVGDYSQLQGSPFVVKNLTCTFTDNSTSSTFDVTALSSLSISSGAEVPDVEDACGSGDYGFAVSPVFWNSSPTVSFTIADTNVTDDIIFARLFSGDTFSIVATIGSPDSDNFITVTLPTVQQTDVTLGEANGYTTYEIQGKCVRAAGDGTNDALMQIVYAYNE